MNESDNLDRFVSAQEKTYTRAIKELRQGKKTSHWMWYIFPQIAGLGVSLTSKTFSIKSLAEAKAYAAHPVLGERLKECTSIVLKLEDHSAQYTFGSLDSLKFRSSMTLFAAATDGDNSFQQALEKYYGGMADEKTLKLLLEV